MYVQKPIKLNLKKEIYDKLYTNDGKDFEGSDVFTA